ncbi:MAG: hypothetical protein Q9187_001795 [Circinaria calcarea]
MLFILFIPYLFNALILKTTAATSSTHNVKPYHINVPDGTWSLKPHYSSGHHTVHQDSPRSSVIRLNPSTSSRLTLRTSSRVNIHKRTNGIQVTLHMSQRIAGAAVSVLLSEAYGVVTDVIEQIADGVIVPPGFRWTVPNGLSITTWNSNNRDMTWSDLGEVIVTIAQLMAEHGWGTANFVIYQASLELGRGEIRQSGTGGSGLPRAELHT